MKSGPVAVSAGRWYLYVARCSDGTLYTGITNNVARRLAQHNAGRAANYTRSRRPVRIIYAERCRGRSGALKKEYAFKQLSRKQKEEYIGLTSHKRAGGPAAGCISE